MKSHQVRSGLTGPGPALRASGVASLLLVATALPLSGAEIAKHPKDLKFPELVWSPPAAKAYRTPLKAGPVAYVAEDRELPLVNIAVTLRGGTYLEPKGKEGLAELAGYLLVRGGTKRLSAEDLEERLAFLAANLNASIGEDRGSVSLNLLSKDVDEGLRLLREVLTEPRFQEDKLTLRREQILNDMKTRNDESAAIEGRERSILTTGEDYYTNRHATKASVESITQKDLADFHRRWFDPRNMMVAVAGDFDRAAMLKKLETLFSAWPFKGEASPAVPVPAHKLSPGLYMVDKDVNQGRVSVLLPGLSRSDPEYFAALLMNDILGGGGFTSRITNRVRSDEGLAYSAGSRLSGGVWYPGVLGAGFQSKVRTCSYATQIVLDEMKKMRDFGKAEGEAGEKETEELATAKKSYVETLPRRFATKAQTLGILVDEEFTGRFKSEPDYYATFRARVEKVTRDDVRKAAERLLKPESATILVVGKKADLMNPDPKHPIPYPELTGGKLTDVPLRDPYTMKPLPAASGAAK